MHRTNDTKYLNDELSYACKELAETLGQDTGVHYLPETCSTNSVVKDLIRKGTELNCLIAVTDNQSAGRGTRGRDWYQQPFQDIAASIGIRADGPWADDPRLSLAIGELVAQAVEATINSGEQMDIRPGVRWPNDLLLGVPPAKFCGILIERSLGWLIVGVGINVNSTIAGFNVELQSDLTTLARVTGVTMDRGALLTNLTSRLLSRSESQSGDTSIINQPPGWTGNIDQLTAKWITRDLTPGTTYRLTRNEEVTEVIAQCVDQGTGELVCIDAGGMTYRISSYTELERC